MSYYEINPIIVVDPNDQIITGVLNYNGILDVNLISRITEIIGKYKLINDGFCLISPRENLSSIVNKFFKKSMIVNSVEEIRDAIKKTIHSDQEDGPTKIYAIGDYKLLENVYEYGFIGKIYYFKHQFNDPNTKLFFLGSLIENEKAIEILEKFPQPESQTELNFDEIFAALENENIIYAKKNTLDLSRMIINSKLNIDSTLSLVIYKPEFKSFEIQWLNLVKKLCQYGVSKPGRNGFTESINDVSIKIDLKDGFPIMTLKKTFWRGIVEELLWMIRGQTNSKILEDKGINIWVPNSNRKFLDSRGLTDYPDGDIGPGYGFQMRHFGANYAGFDGLYDNQGFDQLSDIVRQIKNDPNSRRMIISLWNPPDNSKIALPPCHILYQFTVTNGKLSCHLYQRSWDTMLGWNTTTAALLTHILADVCKLNVGTLTHTICDFHIYQSHFPHLSEAKFFERIPYQLPTLVIKGHHDKPEDYVYEDFVLINYISHPNVKLEMVA